MRTTTPPTTTMALWLLLAFLCGCPTQAPSRSQEPEAASDNTLADMARSTRGALVWKRGPALANGLSEALIVPVSDLCRELGRFDCVEFAHQVPLGGNDPFEKGQYQPLIEPGATTAVAFDRLALSACSVAVEYDRARPASFIFRGHPLDDVPLDPSDAATQEGARFVGQELYRRLHGREPRDAELQSLLLLLTDDEGRGTSGRDFAKLACFAVASTTETILY
jgi:hypothetical protein